jgi:hypothetical protein
VDEVLGTHNLVTKHRRGDLEERACMSSVIVMPAE